MAQAEQQLFMYKRECIRINQQNRIDQMSSLVQVIFLLFLTNAGLENKEEDQGGHFGNYVKLVDWTILVLTLLVVWFLLVFIGVYYDRNTKSAKLGSAKKNQFALLYIPCLVFIILLMICMVS